MLTSVLGVANVEQSSVLPPSIFSSQYNTVTSLLISKLVSLYPTDQTVLDILSPFVERKVIQVKNGLVALQDNYRNLLGSPMISSAGDGCKECDETKKVSESGFEQLVLKSGCKKVELVIVPQSEFGYRTMSTYDVPNFENPIGYMSGKNEIKVCPYDIKSVEVMFVRKENIYVYGYDVQPDDTYTYNPSTSIESEFLSNAFTPIFSALVSLYGAYSRDNTMTGWAQLLNQQGIL